MDENSALKFKTKKARELSIKIINKVKKHLTLNKSIYQLEKFLPTINIHEILSRQEWIKLAIKSAQTISDVSKIQELITLASDFNKDINKRHNNIVIAFGDEEDYDKYKSELSKKFYTTLVQTEHDLLTISHYEQIRYVPSERDFLVSSVEELEQATVLSSKFTLEDLAPEIYTDVVEENQQALSAIKELSSLLKENITIPKFLKEEVKFEHIQARIESASKVLQEVIQSQISIAQFSGSQLVSIIQNNENILDKIPNESRNIILDKKKELIKNIEDEFHLSVYYSIIIDHIGKVLVDEQELEKINNSFQAKKQQNISEFKQSIATQSKQLMNNIDNILYKIHELDLKIAFSLFTQEFDLEFPTIQGKGQSFVYGRNMNLINAVPIEYYIGNTAENNYQQQANENVAVVTGANSGGKTTLLELLAQNQILAQMGLGIPAKESRVGIVEEIYYFSKNKGSANAGAFETLLKQFANISDESSRKLILADEIESVTEPDVAAKIIKGIIHHSQKNPNNILILVTHMGKELSKLDVNARFDGIEAKGLDKDFNLVVDRNPVIGRIARSTPQLIIERLAKKNEEEFYLFLHELVTA